MDKLFLPIDTVSSTDGIEYETSQELNDNKSLYKFVVEPSTLNSVESGIKRQKKKDA